MIKPYYVFNPGTNLQSVIYHADCRKVFADLPDNSIDLIITSPPFNKGNKKPPNNTLWTGKRNMTITYDEYNDDMPEDEYREWQIRVLRECVRVIKPTGSIFYNHKARRIKGRVLLPSDWLMEFNIWQMIVWNRTNTPQVNKFCFYPCTEYFFWITKPGHTPKFHRENAIYKSDVWECPPDINKLHPAPFTKNIVRNILLSTTTKLDVVCDIFAGIGTVGIIAKELDRRFILIEKSKKYCDMARDLI